MGKISNIISEEITKCISEKCMIREYKNPKDSQTVRVCGDMLEQLYSRIIQNGCSRHEITMEMMYKIISNLRRLEQIMS